MPAGVLLVDDHKIMRDGLKAILERVPDFRVVGEAENGPEAVQLARVLLPDVVVMDIGLPGLNGVETTLEILRFHPKCNIVILSMYEDENSVVGAMRAGARGFILKKASDTNLVDALRIVASGGLYVSPQVSDQLVTRIRAGNLEPRHAPAGLEHLSPREMQVLRMVAGGKTSKEIAAVLDLKEHTIRSYRKTLMKKLGVGNAAGLTHLAVTAGLMSAANAQHAR